MSILSRIANIIFPASCRQCGKSVPADTATACFCPGCWDTIKWFDGHCCPKCGVTYPAMHSMTLSRTPDAIRCGLPYPAMQSKTLSGTSDSIRYGLPCNAMHSPLPAGHLCGSCQKTPPYYDKAVSAGPYEDALAEAIRLFKYKKKIHVGRALTNQMLNAPAIARLLNTNRSPDDTLLNLSLTTEDAKCSRRLQPASCSGETIMSQWVTKWHEKPSPPGGEGKSEGAFSDKPACPWRGTKENENPPFLPPLNLRGGQGGLFSDERNRQVCLIPVPLHPRRLREREFNQSAIIASEIGSRLGIPLLTGSMIRHRYTRPQVELDMKERRQNVRGAFSIRDRSAIRGMDILLIDDVYTSGSTINECARILKRHDAGKVYVLTIARMLK